MPHQSLLIVDDDFLARRYLRQLLQQSPHIEVVDDVGDGPAALAVMAATRVDVLLIDVRLSLAVDIALNSKLQQSLSIPRIILMSDFHTQEIDEHALQVGADRFVSKSESSAVFISAVLGEREPEKPFVPRELSARESVIAELAAQGYTNDQIAQRAQVSANTVKTYMTRIFRKIGARNRVDLTNFVNSRARKISSEGSDPR